MLKQFKEFAFKGNLVDMSVAIILGGAFALVVKSLVENVIMPPLGMLLGGIDFSSIEWEIQKADEATGQELVSIKYGQFMTETIAFVMLAFVVFIIVKKFLAAFEKEKEEEEEETPAQEVLLEKILEQLKK